MNTWLESLPLGFPKFSDLRYQVCHFATFGNYTYGTITRDTGPWNRKHPC